MEDVGSYFGLVIENANSAIVSTQWRPSEIDCTDANSDPKAKAEAEQEATRKPWERNESNPHSVMIDTVTFMRWIRRLLVIILVIAAWFTLAAAVLIIGGDKQGVLTDVAVYLVIASFTAGLTAVLVGKGARTWWKSAGKAYGVVIGAFVMWVVSGVVTHLLHWPLGAAVGIWMVASIGFLIAWRARHRSRRKVV